MLALIDLALIVAVAQIGGLIAARLGQPRIAGEMLAVVCIGPTVLGGQIAGIVPDRRAMGRSTRCFPSRP